MMRGKLFILLFLLFAKLSVAQEGFLFGAKGGLVVSSAILPDLESNLSLDALMNGDDIVKGVPQYADPRINYQLGLFTAYDDGFGFSQLEVNYTRTSIYKEIEFIDYGILPVFDKITVSAMDVKYSYLDIALSYNIFLNKNNSICWSLGAGPSFLLSSDSKIKPEGRDLRVFSGFGFHISDNISLNTRLELGVSEVYGGSYIHHILVPVGVSFLL